MKRFLRDLPRYLLFIEKGGEGKPMVSPWVGRKLNGAENLQHLYKVE